MKNPPRLRRFGRVLIVLASLGLLFSLVGAISIWIIRPRLQLGLGQTLDLFQATLTTTEDGILVLNSALENSHSNLDLIEGSLDELGTTMLNVSTSLDTSATLVGDDLRQTIIETQVALSSAADSAKFIDDTLAFIAALPFVGADYQPEAPLHIGLEQVASSLDEIPDSLETLEGNLSDTAAGLEAFSTDLATLSENMTAFSADLDDAQTTLQDYDSIVQQALEKLERLEDNLSKYLIFICIFLSGMLLWLGVAQVNVLLQGLAFVNNELQAVNPADLTREQ